MRPHKFYIQAFSKPHPLGVLYRALQESGDILPPIIDKLRGMNLSEIQLTAELTDQKSVTDLIEALLILEPCFKPNPKTKIPTDDR